jgi:hypothetical protein
MSKYDPSVLRICPLIIVTGLLTSSVAHAGDIVTAGIDLSGTWILNEKLSDNPQEIMRERMESMRPPGGGPPGGGMGGGGMRPPGGGMPGGGGPGGGKGEPNREQMEQRMKQLEPAKRIVILSSDEQVTMIPQGRDTLVVFPDGKKHEHKTPAGVTSIQAEWKDLALEVKVKGQYGREAKRLYRINTDGLLEIVTEFEPPNGGEKITIVSRYDDAEAIK